MRKRERESGKKEINSSGSSTDPGTGCPGSWSGHPGQFGVPIQRKIFPIQNIVLSLPMQTSSQSVLSDSSGNVSEGFRGLWCFSSLLQSNVHISVSFLSLCSIVLCLFPGTRTRIFVLEKCCPTSLQPPSDVSYSSI